ncbi:hypothetical protein GJAV_G00229560 [Gymnothorax javanicus]|nr:hypothetical protein GJAV_G00229560 [Gymnothorax javanicus]
MKMTMMTKEQQKNEDSYKTQASVKACSTTCRNSAEEILGFRKPLSRGSRKQGKFTKKPTEEDDQQDARC